VADHALDPIASLAQTQAGETNRKIRRVFPARNAWLLQLIPVADVVG